MADSRQRFFIQDSPVRGDVVQLERSAAQILAQRDYPVALGYLLGEMLAAVSLMISTFKIKGRLSIQMQNQHPDSDNGLLNWAMAECDHNGQLRALAKWQDGDQWQEMTNADAALAQLGAGVMFINITPEDGQVYQGIVERVSNNLAECLVHYQTQSMQIPTLLTLACDGLRAGGMMVQLLPRTSEEEQQQTDDDLWPRLTELTATMTDKELLTLPATEILYRLYNQETVQLPEAVPLEFGCTCSQQKCQHAIQQIGRQEAIQILEEQDGEITMDCGFCGRIYRFDRDHTLALFQ